MSSTRETPPAGKPPEAKGEGASAGSAAREAERLLAVTLDLLLIADFDYRVRRGNLAWTQVIGYRAEEVLGRSFLEFVHPEDMRRTKEEVDLIAATGSGSVDFGTGYSSLSHLNTLPLDGLKIDRSFVTDIEEDRRSEAIVEAVAAMGRAMGLSVVAEGVETAEHATRTTALGCAFGQGNHFSPPVTPEDVPALLERFLRQRH